jgi:hypothetical protein
VNVAHLAIWRTRPVADIIAPLMDGLALRHSRVAEFRTKIAEYVGANGTLLEGE